MCTDVWGMLVISFRLSHLPGVAGLGRGGHIIIENLDRGHPLHGGKPVVLIL